MAQQEAAKLPEGWVNTTVNDICEKVTDGSHNPPKAKDFGLPMLSAKNIFKGKVNYDGCRLISPEEFKEENKRTRINTGDVLLTTVATLGRTAVVENVKEPFTLQRSVSVMSTEYINSRFLKYNLDSPEVQSFINLNARGNAQKGFYIRQLKELEVKIAPIEEQKRIVNKLDSLLAQVDTIQQRLDSLPDIIKRFRQSVLAAAVSGKLTEQWRETNKAPQPDSINLGKVIELAYGKALPAKARTGEGFPVYGSNGVVGLHKESLVDGPFIVVGRKGSFGVVTWSDCSGWAIDTTYFVKLKNSFITLKFAYYLLQTLGLTSLNRSTAIPGLNREDAYKCQCLLPTLAEQGEIIRLVDQYFALADTLEKHLANAKARVDNLTQSILAKAFRGELVPQDPNDEPADKLLERIKAARIEAEKLEKAAKANARKAANAKKAKKSA